MALVSCPKCSTNTQQGGYPVWVIIVCICFFPVGLLALLAGILASHQDGDRVHKGKGPSADGPFPLALMAT